VVEELAGVLRGKRVVALTGAGCSTESGIPDYRGAENETVTPIRPNKYQRKSIQGPEFARSAATRARYWARAVIGWPLISGARPNAAHHALAELEASGVVRGVITQNVDRLHQAAGSRRVIELHGALAEVGCLDCGALEGRDSVQARLLTMNRGWLEVHAGLAPITGDATGAVASPDGDAELDDDAIASFQVVACRACDGRLKPRVVFFGDNVPRPVVDDAFALLDEADALLVAGSSLTVFSGFRFVRRAAERPIPIAIVNLGPTRGDELAAVTVRDRVGVVLPGLARALA
jgi:NAD-dependent SIR2 family protein deacetylase